MVRSRSRRKECERGLRRGWLPDRYAPTPVKRLAALPRWRLSGELAVQPALRQRPLALHGRRRDAERGRCFLHGQAGEEAQLDDAALRRIELLELLKRAIEIERVDALAGRRRRFSLVERYDDAPAA